MNKMISRFEQECVAMLSGVAAGLQPDLRAYPAYQTLNELRNRNLIRIRPKTKLYEVTSAGYQFLTKKLANTSQNLALIYVGKSMRKITKRMMAMGIHTNQCEKEVARLTLAIKDLEKALDERENQMLAADRMEAGFHD